MKAIIIAAGKGSRLNHLTENLPKCMLDIDGKTILDRQLDAYRNVGIDDISVIKGYCADKIDYSGLTYYMNDEYENNNILHSFMYAREKMNGNLIASYSDIIFESSIVERLKEADGDITVVVDRQWHDHYKGRDDHPVEEAELAVLDENNRLVEIGKNIGAEDDISYEFIGMWKCSKKGAEIFKEFFDRAKTEANGQPFIRAKSFQKAYITDFLQYLVNNKVEVRSLVIEKGWQEIDVPQDIERFNNLKRSLT